jgi:hypothetical protein
MRLLIYLLALLSGFSAAEAARADVAQTSAVAQTAVAVADAMAAQEQESVARPAHVWPRDLGIASIPHTTSAFIAPTPVTRRDVSLQ